MAYRGPGAGQAGPFGEISLIMIRTDRGITAPGRILAGPTVAQLELRPTAGGDRHDRADLGRHP